MDIPDVTTLREPGSHRPCDFLLFRCENHEQGFHGKGWEARDVMKRNGVTYARYGSAATLLKADLANCSSSIHERLYESVSQDPWVVH